MFQAMAQKVKDSRSELTTEEDTSDANATELPQNSILDNIPLAEEHLVFKFSSVDPEIKCSMIVASVNVNKVTPAIITSIMIALRDTLPMFGLSLEWQLLMLLAAIGYHFEILCQPTLSAMHYLNNFFRNIRLLILMSSV